MLAHLTHWLLEYGYAGVFVLVALESLALPLPGETILVAAAIYAGKTHHLRIGLLVLTATIAVIAGGGAGFLLGRTGGYRLLKRYQSYLHLNDAKLRLGRYVFRRYGGRVVFFGRFVALLRSVAGFLAGANHMAPGRFIAFHAAGAAAWAALFGFGGYLLGDEIERFTNTAGALIGGAVAVALFFGYRYVTRNLEQLQRRAEADSATAAPF